MKIRASVMMPFNADMFSVKNAEEAEKFTQEMVAYFYSDLGMLLSAASSIVAIEIREHQECILTLIEMVHKNVPSEMMQSCIMHDCILFAACYMHLKGWQMHMSDLEMEILYDDTKTYVHEIVHSREVIESIQSGLHASLIDLDKVD